MRTHLNTPTQHDYHVRDNQMVLNMPNILIQLLHVRCLGGSAIVLLVFPSYGPVVRKRWASAAQIAESGSSYSIIFVEGTNFHRVLCPT